jgi:hypothetical protein
MGKKFLLTANEIRPIATGHGSCFASDHIVVEGHKVGFMHREDPENEIDSGWRFLSGHESQEYLDDPDHLSIYDVNTVANYDKGVITHLSASVGSAFARAERGEFVESEAPSDPDL